MKVFQDMPKQRSRDREFKVMGRIKLENNKGRRRKKRTTKIIQRKKNQVKKINKQMK